MGGGERTYTIGRTQHDAPVGSEDTRIGHKLFGVKPVGARITFQLSSCGIKDDQPPVRRDPESVVFRDDPLNDLTGQRQGFMANETVFFVITAKSVTVGSDPQPVRAVDGKRVDRIAADPAFMTTKEEILAILKPANFVGRAPEQTADFLSEVIKPILDKEKDLIGIDVEINV